MLCYVRLPYPRTANLPAPTQTRHAYACHFCHQTTHRSLPYEFAQLRWTYFFLCSRLNTLVNGSAFINYDNASMDHKFTNALWTQAYVTHKVIHWAQATILSPPCFTYAKYALLTAAYSEYLASLCAAQFFYVAFSSSALYRLHSPSPFPISSALITTRFAIDVIDV